MAKVNCATDGTRNIVLITPSVPDWATSAISEHFDLHPVDPQSAISRQAEVILTPGPEILPNETLDALPDIKYICCLGSGYEGLDIRHIQKKGIMVSNSAIVTAEDVADQAVAITLAQYANIRLLDQAIRDDRWHKPIRRSLRELNVGVVGLGLIGQAIIRRMEPFGCAIRWTGPREKEAPHPFCEDLAELASWADIMIIAARADQSNVGLINADILDRLGPGGIISNISRGSIINEDALIAALKSGRLGGAALDVFETEPTPAAKWRDVPNITMSPHVGGFATGVRNGIRKLILQNLSAYFAGSDLMGTVDAGPVYVRPGPV